MGRIGLSLALNILPANFFFGLCSSEEVGSQLCAAHIVKNLLFFFNPLRW